MIYIICSLWVGAGVIELKDLKSDPKARVAEKVQVFVCGILVPVVLVLLVLWALFRQSAH